MGLMDLFSRPSPSLLRLPSGSFTVDCEGRVLARTVSTTFPDELVAAVADEVLAAFKEAVTAQLPLSELVITYPSLKITARELRGGAIVFLSPQNTFAPNRQN
jgi:hypothetical protein